MKRLNYDSLMAYESLSALVAELNRQEMKNEQRYQEVKRYLNRKAWEKGVPLTGTFELTPLCNLDCKMCYVHLSRSQMRGRELISAEIWKSLIDQAYGAGMLYARLTGGECLTHPEFAPVYRHLASYGVETAVLTNGVLLGEDTIDLFQEYPPAYVQVTLYGSDEDAYERVTGHRVFSAVLAGIDRVRLAGIPLKVCCTPNRFMGVDAEKTLALIKGMGLPYVVNAGMFAARAETGRRLGEYNAALDDYIRILKYEAALDGREIAPCGDEELPPQRTGVKGGKGIVCTAGRCAFSIAWNGVMRGCNVLEDFCAYPLRDGFHPAWQAVHRAACDYPLPVECFGCRYEHTCKHCVAEHRQGAEKGHANPAVCAWGRRMVKEGLLAFPGAGQGAG